MAKYMIREDINLEVLAKTEHFKDRGYYYDKKNDIEFIKIDKETREVTRNGYLIEFVELINKGYIILMEDAQSEDRQ